VSVILDSLRRARGAAPAASPEALGQPAQKPVPEHLRAGSTTHAAAAPRGLRPSLLIGVVAVAIGIWTVVQLSLGLMAPEPASTPTSGFNVAGGVPPPAGDGPPGPASPARQGAEAIEDSAPADSAAAKPPASEPPARTLREPIPPRAVPTPRAVQGPAPPAPMAQAPPLVPATAAPNATAAAPPMQGGFDLAVKYQAAGNFDQAIAQYLAVLERDPFNLQVRNNLGMLYRDRGARDEAIRQLQLAVKGDPRYLTARRNLAVVYLEAGRLAEARAELNAALRVDPRNVDTLVNLSLVDMASGRSEVAKETLIKALALDSKHALAHYNLALIYEQGSELARAHHHYSKFLDHAEPGYTFDIVNVQTKVDALAAKLYPTERP
jgi:tetratricopeptide (TPR) repeat protein